MNQVRPSYLSVLSTFARNSAVRDMMFRGNFLIECVTSLLWLAALLLFYILIFRFTDEIGEGTGWGKYPFFVFIATMMLVNSLMQTFIMPNAEQFSELIRTGELDFALLKPIDTQFLISFQRMKWSSLTNVAFGLVLLVYSLARIEHVPGPLEVVLYLFYLVCGVAIMYGIMICLAATSVWMGRNQTLYDFWFYITSFSRYPMEIYQGRIGEPIRFGFSFIIPVLLAVNVPARIMARPFQPGDGSMALITIAATIACVLVSRWVFMRALYSYRSASS